ncbi:MAG: hypothetical protein ACFFD2_20995 [Promethearchaeota archaeon]
MNPPPSGSSGADFLPFMTSVTTDIYARIDKLNQAIENVKSMLNDMIIDMKEYLSKIADRVNEMIEQGEMNKQMTLEAFADTTNNLIDQIKIIRNEQVEGLQSTQTQEMLRVVNDTANLLEQRMYDIQIAILINGIHALVNAIKTGNVIGIPVPIQSVSGANQVKSEAPVPSLLATDGTQDPQKTHFFGKGARKKTHEEIMEEKKKKDKLFGTYR